MFGPGIVFALACAREFEFFSTVWARDRARQASLFIRTGGRNSFLSLREVEKIVSDHKGLA